MVGWKALAEEEDGTGLLGLLRGGSGRQGGGLNRLSAFDGGFQVVPKVIRAQSLIGHGP